MYPVLRLCEGLRTARNDDQFQGQKSTLQNRSRQKKNSQVCCSGPGIRGNPEDQLSDEKPDRCIDPASGSKAGERILGSVHSVP